MVPASKMLYVVSMMNRPSSIHALASKLEVNSDSARKHCRELERLGWMKLTADGKNLRPDAVLPPEVETNLASEVRELIEVSHFKGEETTKAFVDWIVAPTVKLLFNARPPFLCNQETGQNLEYDIIAAEYRWALEHQGDQHFGPTELYPGETEFINRFKRDRLKAELSKRHNIRLSTLTRRDLTLEKVLEVIPEDIPRRVFDPKGPYVKMLEKLGREIGRKRDWDRE